MYLSGTLILLYFIEMLPRTVSISDLNNILAKLNSTRNEFEDELYQINDTLNVNFLQLKAEIIKNNESHNVMNQDLTRKLDDAKNNLEMDLNNVNASQIAMRDEMTRLGIRLQELEAVQENTRNQTIREITKLNNTQRDLNQINNTQNAIE